MLFNEVTYFLSKGSLTFESLIIMGYFNTNINTTGVEFDKLDDFCNLFNLTNLIKIETWCTKSYKSTIELFLINRPMSFQKTRATET